MQRPELNIQAILSTGQPIDWLAYHPTDRAWIYVEKYKPLWLNRCRQLCNNWDEARDLFGDTVIIKSVYHSGRYEEGHGTTFTTWMYANLAKELLKAKGATRIRKRRMFAFTDNENGNIIDVPVDSNAVLSDTKMSLNTALEKLKEYDETTYKIFIDFVLNGYKKNMLAARYRCSQWLIGEYIDAAKRILARCLAD